MLGKVAQRVLLASVFLLGVGRTVAAQSKSDTTDSVSKRYWWTTGGGGIGGIEVATTVTGGFPITDHVFVGGRFTYTMEAKLFPVVSPPEKMWSAGPLTGVLLKQGRYGQLSLASGITMGVERRRKQPKSPKEQPNPCGWFCTTKTRYETERVIRFGIPVNA